MKLNELLTEIEVVKTVNDNNPEIKSLKIDSSAVTKNSLFICLKGRESDGHDYVRQAEKYGASAIISEHETETTLPQVIVKDSRKAMSKIAAAFYGNPADKMKLVAVTGTNGKTTTCHILKKILDGAGIDAGVIGTIGTYYKNKFIEPSLTTPDPIELYKIFSEMQKSGVKVVVMEASAHALTLEKLSGLKFEVGVFTNLTQDHLDFFGDMEEYKSAKLKLFKKDVCKIAVVNVDDKTGIEILNSRDKVISYGIDNPSDVFAIDLIEEPSYTEYVLNLFDRVYEIKSSLVGKFNVYNGMAAATAAARGGSS